ncbi:probable serine carboxypeptidase CPVL [Strongylocentrotus purpuratus]|uniref:Carboxypeptidase n=1 Tax=Strongylocentrotus purpuratus TaxID=7668 RepID=A0A7M7TGQ6_STRPU|nr:probable serine carboxypeptidase CPVL [Strongylocentrotus purpuratus]
MATSYPKTIFLGTMTMLAIVSLPLVSSRGAFRAMFHPNPPAYAKQSKVDPGQPLFLTPYIESGQIAEGQKLSRVGPLDGTTVESYSGFLTVNSTYNSSMFFWFFPAQNNDPSAPVLLWLQGGPGGSSLFGLFAENGPFLVTKDLKLQPRKWAWTQKYSMLYIDNPVGTGFSFTQNDAGYANNEEDVAVNLYSALTQFFQLFPKHQKNEFYATGESYAGKYVPAICYKIHTENPTAKVHINLQGMAIGDGLVDPYSMFQGYGDLMYQTSQVDLKQKKVVDQYTSKGTDYINQGKWLECFEQFDIVLNGDLFPYPTFYYNATGSNNYYNFMMTTLPADTNYYNDYLAFPEVRRAIHVGNLTYNDGTKVENHLREDICKSVKDWTVVLADNYRCMFYSGQLDIIVGAALTENFLQGLAWAGQDGYLNSNKTIWKVHPSDTEVAGFVRQYKDFYQVTVRGGGHLLPHDQPERSFDMIDRFITKQSFDK